MNGPSTELLVCQDEPVLVFRRSGVVLLVYVPKAQP